MIYHTSVRTPFGPFEFVSDRRGLLATHLPTRSSVDRDRFRAHWSAAADDPGRLPAFQEAVAAYYRGQPVEFDVDLVVEHFTEFRRRVTEACRRVPYGATISYRDLARAAGNPAASRAVGGVMASNPFPLVVPCHRVLRSDGTLGGFSAPEGLDVKEQMLALERRAAAESEPRNSNRKHTGLTSAASVAVFSGAFVPALA